MFAGPDGLIDVEEERRLRVGVEGPCDPVHVVHVAVLVVVLLVSREFLGVGPELARVERRVDARIPDADHDGRQLRARVQRHVPRRPNVGLLFGLVGVEDGRIGPGDVVPVRKDLGGHVPRLNQPRREIAAQRAVLVGRVDAPLNSS